MVTTRLIGRHGNNCFQIASMVGYAHKHGIQYLIPKDTVAPNLWPNYFEHLHDPIKGMLRSPVWIKEKEHHYQELPAPDPNLDYIMEGYWQSYRYFDFCIDEIRTLFGFDYSPVEACAIHVRRGDYVSQFPDKHPAVTEEYLDKAIQYMQEKLGQQTFMFFSDDILWCMEYAKTRKIKCVFMCDHTPMEDFSMMLRCKNQIIGNSSYSWWAAYLNTNPEKIVVTPDEDNWFGENNKHLSVVDLIPPDWVRIKY